LEDLVRRGHAADVLAHDVGHELALGHWRATGPRPQRTPTRRWVAPPADRAQHRGVGVAHLHRHRRDVVPAS
jgi:hypothetical protein